MPLIKSSSDTAFSSNVAEMIRAGHPRDQALAAAYRVKRGRAMGGVAPQGLALGGPPAPWFVRNEARSMTHSGPIMSAVPGRTDRHNMRVASGAYVLPADSISHLGQNNSGAGMTVAHSMFGPQGPYGMGATMRGGRGSTMPKPPRVRADGGRSEDDTGAPVDVVTAGGEYVIDPAVVRNIGRGDINHGHKVLDSFVMSMRKDHIKTLRGLPGPAKT